MNKTPQIDRTALSHWFPLIQAAGLPVPRTTIVPIPLAAQEDIWAAYDGQPGNGGMEAFLRDLAPRAAAIGYPLFLRNDHTSAKHQWSETCHVPGPDDLPARIFRLAEASECMGPGLPWDVLVLREMLPTLPITTCPGYNGMPVNREFRCFVENDTIKCIHPYWPREALEKGGATAVNHDALEHLDKAEREEVAGLASMAGRAAGGAWSVDVLWTRRGWFVTDMAESRKSYHDPACPNATVR
jgi:hypothetical protein